MKHVLGVLANLPVAILECRPQRGLDLVPLEWREREHGPTSHGGLVGAGREYCGQPARISDRTERRGAGLPHQLFAVRRRAVDEDCEVLLGRMRTFTKTPRGHLCDEQIGIIDQSTHRDPGIGGRQLDRGASHVGARIVEKRDVGVGRQGIQASECTERTGADERIRVRETRGGRGDVTLESGLDDPESTLGIHVIRT